ncbi:hypothetical protein GUJ93_ZPchr0009g2278 [Zizania palustris]|uniref:Uncharacterized protein n=1 Tax=Zizania palustris TaxID=103762 RepID=A0A8J5RSN6_ZIZPA|nr:hypothetical protein GUJ93_ZPchr0009g2278 [Zizania palustris]
MRRRPMAMPVAALPRPRPRCTAVVWAAAVPSPLWPSPRRCLATPPPSAITPCCLVSHERKASTTSSIYFFPSIFQC